LTGRHLEGYVRSRIRWACIRLEKRTSTDFYEPLSERSLRTASSLGMSPSERSATNLSLGVVIGRLRAAGYRLRTQHRVGSYRIDIVVDHGDGKRMAVECDGDRWHRIEDLQRDIARQEVLERVGWRFIRIRGSAFYRNPDAAMAPVFEKLRQAGIVPLSADASLVPQNESELVERVRRRAAEILVDVEEIATEEFTKRHCRRAFAASET
jgi:very-short-patch-repair endonuclease